MIDEVVETILPGGAWLAAGVAIGSAFGGALRPVAVRVMVAGLAAAERLQEVGAEAYERTQDLIAEARHEREQERRGEAAVEGQVEEAEAAPSAARRRPARAAGSE